MTSPQERVAELARSQVGNVPLRGKWNKYAEALDQTDHLGFKNATSARLDSLEAEMTKMPAAVREQGEKTAESTDVAKRNLLVPIYIAIGIGAANLVCLLMLLMR